MKRWSVSFLMAGLTMACHSGTTGSLDLELPTAGTGGKTATGGSPASAGSSPDGGGAAGIPGAACDCDEREVCVDGACLEACGDDTDCKAGSRSRCLLGDVGLGACVECLGPDDCPSDRSHCGSAHACVECQVDADCLDPQSPRCDEREGRCR